MRGILDTHCLTRCHCAQPAVGDSNNSHCLPVKAESLREVMSGLARSSSIDWIKVQCTLRLLITRTASKWGGDLHSLSIIVQMCRLFPLLPVTQKPSQRYYQRFDQSRPARVETLCCELKRKVSGEHQQMLDHDLRHVSFCTQFRVQNHCQYQARPLCDA
jgi:hypothetical protein